MAHATSDPRLVLGAHIHALTTRVLKHSVAKNHFGILSQDQCLCIKEYNKPLLNGIIYVLMATALMALYFVLEIIAVVKRPVTG